MINNNDSAIKSNFSNWFLKAARGGEQTHVFDLQLTSLQEVILSLRFDKLATVKAMRKVSLPLTILVYLYIFRCKKSWICHIKM